MIIFSNLPNSTEKIGFTANCSRGATFNCGYLPPFYKILGWETQFKGMTPAVGCDGSIGRCEREQASRRLCSQLGWQTGVRSASHPAAGSGVLDL